MASPQFQQRFQGRGSLLSKAGISNVSIPSEYTNASFKTYKTKLQLKPLKPPEDNSSIYSQDTKVPPTSTRHRIKSLSSAANHIRTPDAKINHSIDYIPSGRSLSNMPSNKYLPKHKEVIVTVEMKNGERRNRERELGRNIPGRSKT